MLTCTPEPPQTRGEVRIPLRRRRLLPKQGVDVLQKLPLTRLLMVRFKDTVHATGVTGRLLPLRRLARCKLSAEQEKSPVESFRMLWRGKLVVSHGSPTSTLQASWATLQRDVCLPCMPPTNE
jgi:hypothetical protein